MILRSRYITNLNRGIKCGLDSISKRATHRNVGLIGIPLSFGQPREGVNLGTKALRSRGLVQNLNRMGYDVHDYGDMEFERFLNDPPSNNVKTPRTNGAASKMIMEKVYNIIENNEICLAIGGDHSMTAGTMNGHAMAEPSVVIVWVDAHADINTPLTSESGNLHGMPLSFVVKECERYMPAVAGFEWLKPRIWARNLAYVGLRDVDPGERWLIQQLGITYYSIHDVDRYGINEVLQRALSEVDPTGKRPIHLSYDIDALDPTIASSTGTPVYGGLSMREAIFITEEIASTGRLSAMDLVEVNPLLGNEEQRKNTVNMAMEIIMHAFGKKRQGTYPHGYTIPLPDLNMRKKSISHMHEDISPPSVSEVKL